MSYNSPPPMHYSLHSIDSRAGCKKNSNASSCPFQSHLMLMHKAFLDPVNNPFYASLKYLAPTLGSSSSVLSPLLVSRYNLPKPGVTTKSKVCKLASGLQTPRPGLLDLALLVCPCEVVLKHEPDLCIQDIEPRNTLMTKCFPWLTLMIE